MEKPNKELEKLFNKRNMLRTKDDEKSKFELKCADENVKKIKDELDGIRCEEGGIHSEKTLEAEEKAVSQKQRPPNSYA